uniref:YhdP family protein n=1 Tax=Arsukibacterium sp. TaxID=1977258 RepID=UPI002FD969CE
MASAKQVCFYCLHKLWLLLAIVLVLLATLISLLRLSLPYADNYKTQLENMLSQQLGAELQIGVLSAAWHKTGPALLLNDLLLSSPAEGAALRIEQTLVDIDFWGSLISLQWRAEHVELRGLQLTLASEELRVQEPGAVTNASLSLALEQLFFRQLRQFTVRDSRISLQQADADNLVVQITHLNWRNQGNRHQGEGELSIDNVTANTLSFIVDLYGPTLDSAFGQLYLQSNQLDLLPWFRQWIPQTNRLQKASVNFSAWGRIDQGRLQRIQVELAENSVHWQRDGNEQSLQLGQGQLLWLPDDDGWSLLSSELTLQSANQRWPQLAVALRKQQDDWQLALQQVPLQALAPLAQLMAEDHQVLATLLGYQPQAEVITLQAQVNSLGDWQLYSQFEQWQHQPLGDVPGISELSGELWLANDFGRMVLKGAPSELQWDGLMPQSSPYQSLQLQAQWLADKQGDWRFNVTELTLDADDFQLQGQLQLALKAQPELSMLFSLQQLQMLHLDRYLPRRYLAAPLRQYLNRALQQGELSSARFLWHGLVLGDSDAAEVTSTASTIPSAIPSIMQLAADVADVRFEFDANWPAVEQLQANLWLDQQQLFIQSRQGQLLTLPLGDRVQASLASLTEPTPLIIQIQSEPQQDVIDVKQLLAQSPLRSNVGQALEHLGLSGNVSGQLQLRVGLNDGSVRATGAVDLQQLSAILQAPELELTDISGQLRFDNDQISAERLQGRWRGLAFTSQIHGQQQPGAYQLTLGLSGDSDAGQLSTALWPKADRLLSGPVQYQLDLGLQLPAEGVEYQAALSLDLTQTALQLPAPYSKEADVPAQLQLSAQGNSTDSLLQFALNSKQLAALQLAGRIDHSSHQFSQLNLALGQADTALPGSGMIIAIDLAQADLLPWYQLISSQLPAGDSQQVAWLKGPLRLRGKIGQLQLPAGFAFNKTVFELQHTDSAWQLQLNGSEVASRLSFFDDWSGQGIKVQLDYLHLPLPEASELAGVLEDVSQQLAFPLNRTRQPETTWLQLPPIQLSCLDCSIGPYRLGEVNAHASSDDKVWLLHQFEADYKRNRLQLSGMWQPDQGPGFSQFSGKFSSPNIGTLLTEYQLTSAISGSRADVDFALNWPGSPLQYETAGLAGQLAFVLGEGSLTEVSDQGARLFSLFSLDSLLRKLRLDFRDVFAKGFFYNRMHG